MIRLTHSSSRYEFLLFTFINSQPITNSQLSGTFLLFSAIAGSDHNDSLPVPALKITFYNNQNGQSLSNRQLSSSPPRDTHEHTINQGNSKYLGWSSGDSNVEVLTITTNLSELSECACRWETTTAHAPSSFMRRPWQWRKSRSK